jgi:putative transposase
MLLIDALRSNMGSGRFTVHDFVVMPNHIHVLLTIPGTTTIERTMQLIKGGFSYRAQKELGVRGEIWQRGFSDVRITNEQSFREHQSYLAMNPVKAGLASSPEEYPFGSPFLKKLKRAGAKAHDNSGVYGTTEVVPLRIPDSHELVVISELFACDLRIRAGRKIELWVSSGSGW